LVQNYCSGIAETQFFIKRIYGKKTSLLHRHTSNKTLLNKYTKPLVKFTQMLVKAGKLISEKPRLAAEIAVNFLDPDKSLGLKLHC
jgi:hypothetical protein